MQTTDPGSQTPAPAADEAAETLILPHASAQPAEPIAGAAPPPGGVGFALPGAWDSEDHTPFFQRRWVRIAATSIGLIFAIITLVLNLRSSFGSSGGASASAQGTAIAGLSPQDLYSTLIKAPLAPEELPPGFGSTAGAKATDSGAGPAQDHAIGDAEFDLVGPDTTDGFFYTVYPSTDDARGFFNRAAVSYGSKPTGTASSPGFSNPTKCLTATGTPNGEARGATTCVSLVGNVVVSGVSEIAGNSVRGNNASAIALAKAGVAHLQKIGAAAQTPGGVAALLAATPGASTTAAAEPRAVFSSGDAALAQRLYDSLLKAPIPTSELPAGFGDASMEQVDPGAGFKQFRAVGEIGARMPGPDATDALYYAVFPTATDTSVQFAHSGVAQSSTIISTVTPPGFNSSARCTSLIDVSGTGQAICSVVVGNVQVFGLSAPGTGTRNANADNALALMRAGVAHLQRVQAGH